MERATLHGTFDGEKSIYYKLRKASPTCMYVQSALISFRVSILTEFGKMIASWGLMVLRSLRQTFNLVDEEVFWNRDIKYSLLKCYIFEIRNSEKGQEFGAAISPNLKEEDLEFVVETRECSCYTAQMDSTSQLSSRVNFNLEATIYSKYIQEKLFQTGY